MKMTIGHLLGGGRPSIRWKYFALTKEIYKLFSRIKKSIRDKDTESDNNNSQPYSQKGNLSVWRLDITLSTRVCRYNAILKKFSPSTHH